MRLCFWTFHRAQDTAVCWPTGRVQALLAVEMSRSFKLLLPLTPLSIREIGKYACTCMHTHHFLYAPLLVYTHSSPTSTFTNRNTLIYLDMYKYRQIHLTSEYAHTHSEVIYYTLEYLYTNMPILTLSSTMSVHVCANTLRTHTWLNGLRQWPCISSECVTS